jgi:glycosyltransferase involved in cell wall biosynthesis
MGGPIGGARARNVGAEACRGDLIALIDDDDLPAGTDWISRLAANFDDPKCIGVSGRNAQDLAETRPYPDMERAARRCLRFSPLLRIPWTYTRVQRRCAPVDTLAGSNSAIRRDLFARHGGWDEDIRVEDEASFFYRVLRCKAPDEYLAFDPGPTILRRMGVPGGLAKRHINASEYCLRVLDFFVRVIGRYHPWRVALLLPAYGAMSWWWTGDWVLTESHLYTTPLSRAIAIAGLLPRIPWLVARAVARRNDRGDARVYPTNPARSSSPGD